MRIRTLFTAAVLAVGLAAQAQAAPLLDFSFSFTNTGNGGGTVTGIVRGLTANATSAATSVEVTGNTLGFGIGEYVGVPFSNSFTVAGATITASNFLSFGVDNTSPAVTCCTLQLGGFAGLTFSNSTVTGKTDTGLSFVLIPAAVPLPATLPLMVAALAGLAGLAGIGLRRRA